MDFWHRQLSPSSLLQGQRASIVSFFVCSFAADCIYLSPCLSHRTYRCGRQLDVFGHHRAEIIACSEAGVLGKRGFPLECAAAQVCREGGARVTTNMFVRDMEGEREEKARNFGPPTLRGPTLLGPTLLGSTLRGPTLQAPLFPGLGLHPLGPTFRGPHTLSSQNSAPIGRRRNWPKSKLAEVEIGRTRKKELAEVEIGRSRSPPHGHHVGVSSAPGRDRQSQGSQSRWRGFGKMLDAGKRPLTPNFPVKAGELASWSWQLKWVGGGARRQRNSSPHWRKLAPRRCHRFCKAGLTAWVKRWSAILACTAARAFTMSLLDRRPVSGTGEVVPSVQEVLREARFL